MGTLAGELIKGSAASPVPVPSLGRTGRRAGDQSVCDQCRGDIKHASPKACADMKSTGTLALKNYFSSSAPSWPGPPISAKNLPKFMVPWRTLPAYSWKRK